MANSKKVIFLDIDGVLQPLKSQNRFDHKTDDLEKLRETLASKFNSKEYYKMHYYDIGAVYYDWDKEAVNRLKILCLKSKAEIIISSDWRYYHKLPALKAIFQIYELGDQVTGAIRREETPEETRVDMIVEYLEKIPDIDKFIILDDKTYSFPKLFPEQFVHCSKKIFDEENLKKALQLLEINED